MESKALAQIPAETPNAYAAFLDYVNMGWQRSLRKLCDQYAQTTGDVPTKNIKTINAWSSRYQWQERLKAYQAESGILAAQKQREAYSAHVDRALPVISRVLEHAERMVEDFERQRVTRRQTVDDPRDANLPPEQRRQITHVTSKVNTRDLRDLTSAIGQLSKDMRTMLGMPTVTEIQGSIETVIKTYQNVDPDAWDAMETPEIPAAFVDDETEDVDEFAS